MMRKFDSIVLVFGLVGAFLFLMGVGILRLEGSLLLNLEGVISLGLGVFFLICVGIQMRKNLVLG